MYDRVEKRKHVRCYISYLDTVVGGGYACLGNPYSSGEHFNSCEFFNGRIKAGDMDYPNTQIHPPLLTV